jgi:hypothetical protein
MNRTGKVTVRVEGLHRRGWPRPRWDAPTPLDGPGVGLERLSRGPGKEEYAGRGGVAIWMPGP